MTTFEASSLALTAIGNLLLALGIFYAARQWMGEEKSHKWGIERETRAYLFDIDRRIQQFQKQITSRLRQ